MNQQLINAILNRRMIEFDYGAIAALRSHLCTGSRTEPNSCWSTRSPGAANLVDFRSGGV